MIKIIKQSITQDDVHQFLGNPFSDMIKFVADIRKEIIALGGELHSDAEAMLLETGSSQADLWGGNYYPARPQERRIEYTSLINIRPSVKNNSIEIKNEKIRSQIKTIALKLLP